MQASFGFVFLLAAAHASQIEVTPVQKVISLLGGMLEKGKKEKHDEQLVFATNRQYCGDQETKYSSSIKQEDQVEFTDTATISKASADASSIAKKIGSLAQDEATWTHDKEAATQVRTVEAADYVTTHKEYSEAIDAMDRAVAALKKMAFDRKQADEGVSLAQVRYPTKSTQACAALMDLDIVPSKDKRAIDLFLQQGEEETALTEASGTHVRAPEENGYEFQSQGVVDMIEKLQDKFIDEKATLEKEEANMKHAHAQLVKELDLQVKQAEEHRGDLSQAKMGKLQIHADASGDLKSTEDLEVVDTKGQSDLKSSCAMKAADFEARQKLRTEEIQGIEKAIEIISSGSVSGNAQKHLPALMQKKATSFVFLGQKHSQNSVADQAQDRVVQLLRARAKELSSRVLATVADRAAADPFAKVKKMLNDLVVRLMEEANEESTHKGWCDTELGANAGTRKEKSEAVDTLTSEIDELTASMSKIDLDLQDLSQAVADLSSSVATLTQARNAEHAANTEAITDSADAQTALAQANTVLKEFYARAAAATSLVQQPYQGMQAENGGVVAMLEVLETDFARLEAETKANEATSQQQYDQSMTDAKVERASKNTAIEHKGAKKVDESRALASKKVDLEETQTSLDKALTYYDKLKPSCVDAGVSYEDRVQRRKAEIESLQEALKVMAGEDFATN